MALNASITHQAISYLKRFNIYFIIQELTKFGITNIRHKERLLEGQNLIKIAEDTQLGDDITPSQSFSQQSHSATPFIPSMLSQSSVSSGGPVEVLRIQIKKTFSSSSNSSNE